MKTFRLGLEWFLNPDHLPFLIGLEKGWFYDAGLDLQLVEPAAHFDASEALASGELDAAITHRGPPPPGPALVMGRGIDFIHQAARRGPSDLLPPDPS